MRRALPLVLLAHALVTGCGDDGAATAEGNITLTLTTPTPDTAPAGESVTVAVEPRIGDEPLPDTAVTATVVAGGGSVQSVATDELGVASVAWTLGVVPVDQRLELSTAGMDEPLVITVRAERDTPLGSEPFADVAGFLEAEGIDASTEDLVFVGDHVLLGAPGGLLEVGPDESIAWVPLTGDPVLRGWGIAAQDDGALWLVDLEAQTLLRVSPERVVTTVLTDDGEAPFEGLNDVEVGPDGKVYATDPCRGRLVRYDPTAGVVDATHDFDLATEGGPNGMAWDAAGRLHVTTENTLLLCPSSPVEDHQAPLAGVYRLEPDAGGFGDHEAVAEGIGTFGDGLTFDADGNLYAIIDTVDGLNLAESAVVVLPNGDEPPQTLVVADDVVYANLAFGRGAFGEETLYLALLQVPVVSPPSSRGLQRVELGVGGPP